MEQLTGGWSTTYLNRALGARLDVAARSVALYWAAVTVGRLIASALAVRLSNERLLGGSIIVALAALVALATAGAVGPALLALTVVGLSFAPIYPTIMAIAARAYPVDSPHWLASSQRPAAWAERSSPGSAGSWARPGVCT